MTTIQTQNAVAAATRYYIRAEYFYYSGTCYAPQDGALRDESKRRLEFATREEAKAYLCDNDAQYPSMGCTLNADGKTYSRDGMYCTSHGEYSRPVYTIRKVPASRR